MRMIAAVVLLLAPAGITDEEFTSLKAELGVKARPWASIPWKVSLHEAREAAAREGKPLFVNVNTGNALGFV